MALPEDFLDELRSKNDITSVISMYANLKKRGRNYVCKCPFHNDSTPSFTALAVPQAAMLSALLCVPNSLFT